MRRRVPPLFHAACIALLLPACGDDDTASRQLSLDTTWNWQLQGELDLSVDADLYDIDLFTTTQDEVDTLHDRGRIVVCYFSAGSYEDFRPDADRFTDDDLGSALDGWPDERWVDIRRQTVRDIVTARLDLAVTKGCDGVEPDNVDGHANDSGFDLSHDDQLDFNRFVAEQAHQRGLLVGLKNDLDQIVDLVHDFDFAVNEQCFEFDECDANRPFLELGKPVFNAEYDQTLSLDVVCSSARDLGMRTLLLPLELDGSFRTSCDDLPDADH